MFNTLDSELFNSFIKDEIQLERITVNRQVIDFLNERKGCDKWWCGTCGGLSGFGIRFDEYLKGIGISRLTGLCVVVPEDLVQIEKWQKVVEYLIFEIPQEQKDTLFRSWIINWGKVNEYDKFILSHLLPKDFLSTQKGKSWVVQALFLPFCDTKIDLVELISAQLGDELEIITKIFKNSMMEAAREKEEVDRIAFEIWKQNNQNKYNSMVDSIKREKMEQDNLDRRNRELSITRVLEQDRIKEERELKIQEIASQEPIYRLKTLLDDNYLHLDDIPVEWSQFDLSIFETLGSREISQIILGLSKELRRMNNQQNKVSWRDFRTKLYFHRQNALKREFRAKQ